MNIYHTLPQKSTQQEKGYQLLISNNIKCSGVIVLKHSESQWWEMCKMTNQVIGDKQKIQHGNLHINLCVN